MSKPQFAILRFAKYKGPEISNIEAHNERDNEKAKPVRHSAHPLRCIVKKALLSNPLKIAVMMSCSQVTPIDFSVPCAFALNRVISHVSAHLLSCSEKRDSVKPFLPSVK